MQIWPYTFIWIGSLSTFFITWLIRYSNQKAADISTFSSIITEKENSTALNLGWKELGKKKYVFVDQYFTTNEAKDC